MATKNPNLAKDAKAKEVKAATKKVSERVKPYKHEASPRSEQFPSTDSEEVERVEVPGAAASVFGAMAGAIEQGVDRTAFSVVESGSLSPSTEGTTMETPVTDTPAKTKQELDAEKAQAKIAEKAKKAEAAAALKAAREKERAEAKAKKDAEKAEKAAKAAAERGDVTEATVSMRSLSERVKAGVYTKGLNGQLRSNDDVAVLCEAVPPAKMVEFLMKAMQLSENPYAALNYGQQSMNLRNRLRGLLRKKAEVGPDGAKVAVTIEYLRGVRDEGGFATAEAEVAAKKAEAEKKKAEKAAAEAVAKAKKTEPATEAAPV